MKPRRCPAWVPALVLVLTEGAYEDTLSDEVLGTLGAFLAGLVVARRNAAPD